MRQITGAAIAAAAACVLGAVALANIPVAGHSAPPLTKKTHHGALRPPPVRAAPSYVTIDGPSGTAIVRRTSSGAKLATVRPPHGAKFIAVGGAQDDRTFVLAADRSTGIQLYRLDLNRHGQPKRPPVKLGVPPLPSHIGSCPAELAGLAVGPADGGVVAASILSYCPTGQAGKSEILAARISSGGILTVFYPGQGYPMWLSWTSSGNLVYDWSGSTTGVFVIPRATKPNTHPRLLIGGSASVGGFSDPNYPLITLDGKAVLVTVTRGSGTFRIAAFSANGKVKKLLTPPIANPAKFCGALWVDVTGSQELAACGDGAEFEIQNGKATRLHRPWLLPTYPTPGAPLIAW